MRFSRKPMLAHTCFHQFGLGAIVNAHTQEHTNRFIRTCAEAILMYPASSRYVNVTSRRLRRHVPASEFSQRYLDILSHHCSRWNGPHIRIYHAKHYLFLLRNCLVIAETENRGEPRPRSRKSDNQYDETPLSSEKKVPKESGVERIDIITYTGCVTVETAVTRVGNRIGNKTS